MSTHVSEDRQARLGATIQARLADGRPRSADDLALEGAGASTPTVRVVCEALARLGRLTRTVEHRDRAVWPQQTHGMPRTRQRVRVTVYGLPETGGVS